MIADEAPRVICRACQTSSKTAGSSSSWFHLPLSKTMPVLSLFFFFPAMPTADGILVLHHPPTLHQGLNLCPLHRKHGVLTTRPRGTSPTCVLRSHVHCPEWALSSNPPTQTPGAPSLFRVPPCSRVLTRGRVSSPTSHLCPEAKSSRRAGALLPPWSPGFEGWWRAPEGTQPCFSRARCP